MMGREHRQIGELQSWVDKEQAKVEREIIEAIHRGNGDSLKPNSGESVTIREHCLCVYKQEEKDPDCVLWQWHGHITTYDPEEGFKLEYIYGHYYQQDKRYLIDDELSDAIDAQILEGMESMEMSKLGGGPVPHQNKTPVPQVRL